MSAKVYPSLTRLAEGDVYDTEHYGTVTVLSVKRARNNRGILPYDCVKVSYNGTTSYQTMIIPTFKRPEGVR